MVHTTGLLTASTDGEDTLPMDTPPLGLDTPMSVVSTNVMKTWHSKRTKKLSSGDMYFDLNSLVESDLNEVCGK